jgi:hypothetical protein
MNALPCLLGHRVANAEIFSDFHLGANMKVSESLVVDSRPRYAFVIAIFVI